MADLPADEFFKRLQMGGATAPAAAPIGPPAPTEQGPPAPESARLPLASEAIARTQADFERRSGARPSPQGKGQEPDFATRLGARPGIPFDTETGAPMSVRYELGRRRDPEAQLEYLKHFYGENGVRQNQMGDWVVTTSDNGQRKDMLVNPMGVDWKDLSELAGHWPEMLGGTIGFLAAKKVPMGGKIMDAFKNIVGGAAGAEGGGFLQDIQPGVSDKGPGELASERAGMTLFDIGFGAALGGGAKALSMAISPFSNVGPIQFKAREAQRFFKENYGVTLALTPAESTGSTLLYRAEALASKKPGSSVPFDKFIADRHAKIKELQDIAMGGAVPDEELAGQRALAALGGKTAPLEFEVQRRAGDVVRSAEGELQRGITAATGVSGPVNKTTLGKSLREGAYAQREAFETQSEANYGKVFGNPLTQSKNISGNELSKDADALLKQLPSKEKVVETIDFDQYGGPLLRTSKGDEVMREFVPPGVLTKLQALKGTKGSDFRLDELMQMRREVDNAIAEGEAIPGYQTHYLAKVRTSLTNRIKTGLNELDPQLLKDWEHANSEYAKGVKRFKQAGIAEMFRSPEQVGSYVGDTELVARGMSGKKAQDVYASYRDFYGAGSPEMKQFRRSVADDVLGQTPLSDVVDATGFVRRLDELAKDAPDVFAEVFGKRAKDLRSFGQILKAVEGNLPERELTEAIAQKTLSTEKLRDLLSAQATRDQAYRNTIVKQINDGSLKADKIVPTDFVNKLVFDKNTQPGHVTEIVSLLSDRPDVLEDVRRLAFQKVLDRASVVAPNGQELINANLLESILKDKTFAKRLAPVVGQQGMDFLDNLKNLMKPAAIRETSFQAAGGFAAGAQVSHLIESGELKFVDRAIKNFVLATVYTSPALRNAVGNTVMTPGRTAAFVNLMIASEPFLEAVSETYGPQAGKQVVQQLKQSIDKAVAANPQSAATPNAPAQTAGQPQARPGDLPENEFMRRLMQNAPVASPP